MVSLDCFEDVVKEVKVFARPRKMPELGFGWEKSGSGRCCERPAILLGESEPSDGEHDAVGTVRLLS